MTRLIVNDQERLFDRSTAKTWGDLLEGIDERCQADGHVVTAVRLDGVEEPSFRDATATGRALADLAVVEVDTATPLALLRGALDEGRTGLERLSEHAGKVGRLFRGHDLTAAHQALLELVQGMQALASLVSTIGTVVGSDLRTLECDGRPTGLLLEALGGHLDVLISAQQNGDWLTVADVIEYDVEPALRGCRPVFEALGSAARQVAH